MPKGIVKCGNCDEVRFVKTNGPSIPLSALLGDYQRPDPTNEWHKVSVTQLSSSVLLWTNRALVSWQLIPRDDGTLWTSDRTIDNGYYTYTSQQVHVVLDLMGDVLHLGFGGEAYVRWSGEA